MKTAEATHERIKLICVGTIATALDCVLHQGKLLQAGEDVAKYISRLTHKELTLLKKHYNEQK